MSKPSIFLITAAIACQAIFNLNVKAQTVSTPAGTGAVGSTDGAGNVATFNWPSDIVRDASGNFYIADIGNHNIRKMDGVTNAITIFAGSTSGISGSADGPRLSATFNGPCGLAIDATGNLFVTDRFNHTIRKIDIATGMVSTFVGTAGSAGTTLGTGSAARFRNPDYMAFDATGNLFVTDFNNNAIKKITPAGDVTLFAGSNTAGLSGSGSADGTGSAALFKTPIDLAFDASGNLFVTDYGNQTIRKITPEGVVTTFAGSVGVQGAADGTGTAATFNGPSGIEFTTSGDMYISDYIGYKIRKVTSAGVVTSYAGVGTPSGYQDGPAATAKFFGPAGMALTPTGKIYITDLLNSRIRTINPSVTLPLNWIAVNANLNSSRQAAIQWSVNEHDINFYQIEKSKDGIRFDFIGKTNSVGNGIKSYSFTDKSEFDGATYYRIKQTGNDGTSGYSVIMKLNSSDLKANDVTVFPNPFTEHLTISSKYSQAAFIYDVNGKLVRSLQLNAGLNNIDVNALGSGSYFLKTANGQMKTIIKK